MPTFSEYVQTTLDERFPDLDDAKIEKKLWGAAVAESMTPYSQVSIAILDKGGYSSRHWHNQKVNVFSVIEGELVVRVWHKFDPANAEIKRPDEWIRVMPGDSIQIANNVIHQMEAKQNTICFEMYFAGASGHRVAADDIHRITIGGMH